MFSKEYRKQIKQNYEAQLGILEPVRKEIEEVLSGCTEDEQEALQFLYGAMPVSDAFDYSPQVFLSFAKHGVFLWREGPFAGRVPEKLFANYVLHYRVNNEDISENRTFFYGRLAEDICGKMMYDNVIAANYWCAAEGNYRTTDDRTESPLTMYRSAAGRCGEESTFAVSVFRSLGIPARQVYVPLWAHCDDNHAWVEVWCDGNWHFLGACEPEEELDRGWFAGASARAMLVHSRWFGKEEPEDEIVGQNGMSRIINHLDHYADTARITVRVLDQAGNGVPGADVTFEVLNYGGLGPVASVKTGEDGRTSLKTGYGTLHVSAAWDGYFGETVAESGDGKEYEIVLGKQIGNQDIWVPFDMHAPMDAAVHGAGLSEDKKRIGEKKAEEAGRKRELKIRGFFDEEIAKNVLAYWNGEERTTLTKILEKSRGNLKEITRFLAQNPDGRYPQKRKLQLLQSLREKDYWDICADILDENCAESEPFYGSVPDDIFVSFLLCPRVSYEMIRPFRRFLLQFLSEEEKKRIKEDPGALFTWVEEHVQTRRDQEYGNLITSAAGCLRGKIASSHSKQVLCVQILRTLGIPARLNPVDHALEYYRDGGFHTIIKREEHTRSAELILRELDEKMEYFHNFTLAKLRNGRFEILAIDTAMEDGMLRVPLVPGTYRIVTATRLTNGSQLAQSNTFVLEKEQKKEIPLFCRGSSMEDMLECISIDPYELHTVSGEAIRLDALASGGKTLFIWLEENREPSEHILNELWENRDQFHQLSAEIYIVVKKKEVTEHVTVKKALDALPRIGLLIDDFSAEYEHLARTLYLEPGRLPLIAVLNERSECIYAVAGYNVGTADMLLRILNHTKAKA